MKKVCARFEEEEAKVGKEVALALILFYELQSAEEISKRGIIEINEETNVVQKFLEKPKKEG